MYLFRINVDLFYQLSLNKGYSNNKCGTICQYFVEFPLFVERVGKFLLCFSIDLKESIDKIVPSE